MKNIKLNPLPEAEPDREQFLLKLFITGSTPNCTRAIQNIRTFCEANLEFRYQLEVVDLYQNPEQASSEQIVVTPTLIKKYPLPMRKLVGDLSDSTRIMAGLDIAAGRK